MVDASRIRAGTRAFQRLALTRRRGEERGSRGPRSAASAWVGFGGLGFVLTRGREVVKEYGRRRQDAGEGGEALRGGVAGVTWQRFCRPGSAWRAPQMR